MINRIPTLRYGQTTWQDVVGSKVNNKAASIVSTVNEAVANFAKIAEEAVEILNKSVKYTSCKREIESLIIEVRR